MLYLNILKNTEKYCNFGTTNSRRAWQEITVMTYILEFFHLHKISFLALINKKKKKKTNHENLVSLIDFDRFDRRESKDTGQEIGGEKRRMKSEKNRRDFEWPIDRSLQTGEGNFS